MNGNDNDDYDDMIPEPQALRQVVDRYLQKHNDDPATSDRLRLALFEYAGIFFITLEPRVE